MVIESRIKTEAKGISLEGISIEGINIQTTTGELAIIPAVYYVGPSQIVNGYSNYSGGSFSTNDFRSITGGYWYGSIAGNYIEFEFFGTWFDVVFYSKSGTVKIYVDGTAIATVDVSTLKGSQNNLVWHGPRNLSDDYHTVRIEIVSGTVRVVGIMVDPSKNAWRIIPFPYTINYSLYQLFNYSCLGANNGIYVKSYTANYPVFIERWPAYVTSVSTTTPLSAGGVWTSSSVDCFGTRPIAKKIYITVYSDQSGTIYIEYSPDNTNWDSSESISYTGGTKPAIQPIEVKGRYARIRYVNGNTAQSVFRLYAWFLSD